MSTRACPTTGGNAYPPFDGAAAVYRDRVENYSTEEPAIDLTASFILMLVWWSGTVPVAPPVALPGR